MFTTAQAMQNEMAAHPSPRHEVPGTNCDPIATVYRHSIQPFHTGFVLVEVSWRARGTGDGARNQGSELFHSTIVQWNWDIAYGRLPPFVAIFCQIQEVAFQAMATPPPPVR